MRKRLFGGIYVVDHANSQIITLPTMPCANICFFYAYLAQDHPDPAKRKYEVYLDSVLLIGEWLQTEACFLA
jgi:hypothetical protein